MKNKFVVFALCALALIALPLFAQILDGRTFLPDPSFPIQTLKRRAAVEMLDEPFIRWMVGLLLALGR